MTTPRLASFPCARAAAWRWELAQLELGCGEAWPRPGSRIWSARAARLGEQLRGTGGAVVVAFEGYTLVGAVWPRHERPVLPRGPFVMPQFLGTGLERRLLAAWLRGCERESAVSVAALPLQAVG